MTHKEAKNLIEDIHNQPYQPSEWESEFLDSIENQTKDLTFNQICKLHDIYAKSGNDSKGEYGY